MLRDRRDGRLCYSLRDMEWLKVVFIDSWAAILHQPFPFAVVAVICFVLAKWYLSERIEVVQQRLDARNEDLRMREGELKRCNETLSTLLKSSSPATHAANSLREQTNLLAAKLLDFSYAFPPVGNSIAPSQRDEALQYYDRNIRPELEYLLLKFREQEGKLLEDDVRVHSEYHNFEKYIKVTHEPRLLHLFGRHEMSEMAQQLALLALRVEPINSNA